MPSEIIVRQQQVVTASSNQQTTMQRIASMVLDTVSERSRRDYGRALIGEVGSHVKQTAMGFIPWFVTTGQTALNKATINAHVAYLKAQGVTDSSINQRLAAIRKLALEAADNGLIDESAAQAIGRVENVKVQGKKLGNWLSREQASAMLNAPDTKTVKGLRDRAILGLMLGCGLRREELTTLTVAHLQQREGRWVILDLNGKHNRTRTIPMASWVKALIDQWTQAAGITSGLLFRAIRRGGHTQEGGMTAQAIWYVVEEYSPVEGLAPHDLRRTFAKLADKAGAPLAQIQKTLGHASIQTTERYVGNDLDLQNAPSDLIRLDIAK